ncbi:MAG TPA: hypothetical protein VI462_17850 [Acidimicrobiia bacterium]
MHLAPYLVARAERVLDAWGQLAHRAAIDERVGLAAAAGSRRAGRELQALLATEATTQPVTPLQIVRRATTEVTAVLADAGVPAVARDEHEERIAPDDRYDLAPRAFADLDATLGSAQLVWGAAKAAVVRADHDARRA